MLDSGRELARHIHVLVTGPDKERRRASVVSGVRRQEAPIDKDRIEGGEADETAHRERAVAHSFVVKNEPWTRGEQSERDITSY